MFLNKILAAILLLQVVCAVYIPVESVESADATSTSTSSSESIYEVITDVSLDIESNEQTSTDVQDPVIDQIVLPLMDIKRVQNVLFVVSMNVARRVTYLLMKYSMRIIFMILAMMFPQAGIQSLLY